MDQEKEIEMTPAAPEESASAAPRENASDAVEELKALAQAEAEQWDYLPKPPRRLRSGRDHMFLKTFLSLLLVFCILFGVAARSVFGKGWINRIFRPEPDKKGFTLPIAEYPELDERFYQPDGRYTVEGVYEAVSPSIVTVEAFDDSAVKSFTQGSGIIMSDNGYVITNAHVVELARLALKVRLRDGTEYSAAVIGSDSKSDIAILKINARDLPAAQFGDSDKAAIGEQVVAIGSPAGLESSITTGIISGVDRMIRVESDNIAMSCIQIDAAINPGNSGGALVNMWGQVVGITSSKLDALEYDNIGFAIETSAAQPIIEELIENGAVTDRPKIGISFYETTDAYAEIYGTPAGLHIEGISEDCDIANTELRVGDYIVSMNGVKVRTADDVYGVILKLKPGDTVIAEVVRELESGELEQFEISFKLMLDDSFIEVAEADEDDEEETDRDDSDGAE